MKIPDDLKKAIKKMEEKPKVQAFNPVLKERDMARQAAEDGSVNSDYLVTGND